MKVLAFVKDEKIGFCHGSCCTTAHPIHPQCFFTTDWYL